MKEKIEQFEGALKGALLDVNQPTRAAALDIASLFLTEENILSICDAVSQILWYNYNQGTEKQHKELENLLTLFYTEPHETCQYESNNNPTAQSCV